MAVMPEDAEELTAGRPLVYVALVGGQPWWTEVRLRPDGSGHFFTPDEFGVVVHKLRSRPAGLRWAALRYLAIRGFVPAREAVARGWVPAGWRVPEGEPHGPPG
jgi:hypothetical protein